MESRSAQIRSEKIEESKRCTLVVVLGSLSLEEGKQYWSQFNIDSTAFFAFSRNIRQALPRAIKKFLDQLNSMPPANLHESTAKTTELKDAFGITLGSYYWSILSGITDSLYLIGDQVKFDEIGVPHKSPQRPDYAAKHPAAYLCTAFSRFDAYYAMPLVLVSFDLAIPLEEVKSAFTQGKISSLQLQDKITRIVADRDRLLGSPISIDMIAVEIDKNAIFGSPSSKKGFFSSPSLSSSTTPAETPKENWYIPSLKDTKLATAALHFYSSGQAPFNTMTPDQHLALVKAQPEAASRVLRKDFDANELLQYVEGKGIQISVIKTSPRDGK